MMPSVRIERARERLRRMSDYVIISPEGKENQLKIKKTRLNALLRSYFYTEGMDKVVPSWLLDGEIKDIRMDDDFIIVVYEEEGEG